MMRAVIADDEPLARRLIEKLCADRPQLEVVAQASNGRGAIDAIRRNQPDLVLLDVELGDMTGFDVLSAVRAASNPLAILFTGQSTHAPQAFDAGALDFVTKPIDGARFHAALDRATGQWPAIAPPRPESAPSPAPALRLIAERARRVFFIEAADIDYLEADGNYVTLHVGQERYLTRQTLTELSRLLEPVGFLRIERGLSVNLRQVAFAERLERGAYAFSLRRGHRLL
jgi:two-component system LytT family response regulator